MSFSFGAAPVSQPATKGRRITQATLPLHTPRLQAGNGEGNVKFPSRSANYRYKMTAKDGRVHFWLEDCSTKQQWESAKLSTEEFTTPETVIPQAGFLDYVSCFHSCLDANIATDSSEFARDLTPHESDDWEMRLTLKIKVFLSVWTVTYSFVLKQISLEPIDVLSAKIRDQADHIKALENEIEQLKQGGQKPIEPVFVQGVTSENRPNGHKLVWKYDGGDVGFGTPRPIIFNPNGTIAVSKPGVYVIHVVVQAVNQANGAVVELLQNDKRVATTTIAIINNVVSTPLHRVLSLGLEDQLAIVYKGNNQSTAGSSLVMYKLQ